MFCKICNKKSHNEFCFNCKLKKPLLNKNNKGFLNKKPKIVQSEAQLNEMKQFFLKYWKIHKIHNCANCNKFLGTIPKTYMFDHSLEKSKYPELMFEIENIMYLCLECHDKKTRGFYSDIIKNKINYLKIKFNKL